jgi:sugar phosphate isomerase/epimerase
MLATCVAALPALKVCESEAATALETKPSTMGLVSECFTVRRAAERGQGTGGLNDPIAFLEHCHHLGSGGAQIPIGIREPDYITRLRGLLDRYNLYLEGSLFLPRERADLDRFEREVRTAKKAGVRVLRTVMLGGRRYETFATATAFKEWGERAVQSLTWVEPIVARHQMSLAVENHKDWRAVELIEILKKLDSRNVGVCVDTGNNLALLEDPLEVVQALAPWALSTHLKDMAVSEYEDGFLLSEVRLGSGFVDLKRVVAILRQARPEIRFNLEMITRDPLKVPCLTPKYWATFETLPGRHLADTLALVRKQKSQGSLPRVSDLTRAQKLAIEEDNVRACLDAAQRLLGL